MQNDKRRAAFIDAADELFLEKGIANTSIGDIANRVGVTRSLFYHYFDDKQGITDAVIDKRVDKLMESLRTWTREMAGADMHDALIVLAGKIRSYLLSPASLESRIVTGQDSGLFQHFVVRSSRLLAELFASTSEERGSLGSYSNVRHYRESFYVLSVGIMSTMRRDPLATDEVIVELVEDALNLDLDVPAKLRGVGGNHGK